MGETTRKLAPDSLILEQLESFFAFHSQNMKQSKACESVYFADGEGCVDTAGSQKQEEQMGKKSGIWGIKTKPRFFYRRKVTC